MEGTSDATKTVTPATGPSDGDPSASASATGAAPEDVTRVVSGDGEKAPSRPAKKAEPRRASVERGDQVGRYVILGRTGSGGMGDVYAAFDPELDRKVALKLLPANDHSSRDGEARLLREAQAMAKLSHPNVIAVHDAGTYDGHVFIAMEFIEGQTLKAWLDAAPRTWQDVLAVMLPAGRGLAAAHRAGIIHRDFKPANVMIREDGAVRVLDFGLARRVEGQTTSFVDADELTRSRDSLDGNLTRTGMVTGTPAYMAPEQFAGLEQDERTDQFGFCVAVYEAVYGERPFEGTELRALSKAVRTGKLRPVPSGSRVPQRLRRCLRRGLSANAAARYGSMMELITELERAARPPWRKIAPWTAGFGGFGAVALAVAMPRAAEEAPCQGAAAQLAGVWDDARKSEVEAAFIGVEREYAARAWQEVQTRLDDYAAAWVQQRTEACEATRIRGEQSEDLLDRRMACLDQRRDELAAMTGVFAEADAQIVEKSIETTGKLAVLSACEQSNVLLDRVSPPDPSIADEVATQRAEFARIKVLVNAGKYLEAIEPTQAALARAREVGYRPLVGQGLQTMGTLMMAVGKADEAKAALEEGLLLSEAIGDAEMELRMRISLTSLIGMYLADPEGGRQHAAFARAVSERVSLEGDLVGTVELVEGIVDYRAGDFDEARAKLEASLVLRQEALGERTEAVAMVLTNLGATLVEVGENERALARIERAREIQTSLHGPSHPIVGTITNNLSLVHFRLGHHEEALRIGTEALEIWRRALPPNHPDLAKALHNLGAIQSKLGHYEQALARYEQALEIKRVALGDQDPSVAITTANIADSLNGLGRYEEAIPYVERAAKVLVDKLGPEHPQLGGFYATYAESLLETGRREQAVELLHESEKILDANPGLVEDRAGTKMLLARALWPDPDRRAEARRAAEQARDGYIQLGAGFDDTVRDVDAWLSAHAT